LALVEIASRDFDDAIEGRTIIFDFAYDGEPARLGHHVVEAEKNVELNYRLATDGRSQKEDRPQPDGQTQSSYRADCSTIEIIICGKIAYCQSSSIANVAAGRVVVRPQKIDDHVLPAVLFEPGGDVIRICFYLVFVHGRTKTIIAVPAHRRPHSHLAINAAGQ